MDSPSEVTTFLPCLVSPKVAAVEIGMIAAIVAILTWKPQLSLTTAILIVFIILIGLAAIVSQVNELFRLRMAKRVLPLRLEEGQALFDRTRQTGPTENRGAFLSWNNLTEQNLRKYVDELHVARFRFAGHQHERPGDFTIDGLDKKLEFLDALLQQLSG